VIEIVAQSASKLGASDTSMRSRRNTYTSALGALTARGC
jgi:hypothetical protein